MRFDGPPAPSGLGPLIKPGAVRALSGLGPPPPPGPEPPPPPPPPPAPRRPASPAGTVVASSPFLVAYALFS
ncbi:hypothetical protein BFL43_25390 [Williamsia sp. 1135]|nr:hypothetical protein BFL43_25390 [Williamsia sp. 1135]